MCWSYIKHFAKKAYTNFMLYMSFVWMVVAAAVVVVVISTLIVWCLMKCRWYKKFWCLLWKMKIQHFPFNRFYFCLFVQWQSLRYDKHLKQMLWRQHHHGMISFLFSCLCFYWNSANEICMRVSVCVSEYETLKNKELSISRNSILLSILNSRAFVLPRKYENTQSTKATYLVKDRRW